MQKREMSEIKIALIALQEITVAEELYRKGIFLGHIQEFILGKERRLIRSQVSEDSARVLFTGISGLAYRITMYTA